MVYLVQPYLNWRPIEEAPRELECGVDPLILIAHFNSEGRLVWAMAAQWRVEMYGYISCASRSGWQVDYMPAVAFQHHRPNKSDAFVWLFPDQELRPTHWAYLPGLDQKGIEHVR